MYEIRNPMDRALEGLDQAASTYASMDKDIPAEQDPGPTAGGAITAGVSGAVAGATTLGALSTSAAGAAPILLGMGPAGWLIGGAALGASAYLLS